ncbi:sulfite exporter TauE/SafE family protein [Pseudooceanicola sp. CBS1P-1]|uniref:Probable membrane transporter protein n=1 Tax=Pseudooceanicola albus TaxID=2692189 RepID=A0A6L7G6H7_9RHOB|nr:MULTISPECIES: sulfite exporter TauE/SafE family protein [Pseudooceanicola]MBT9384571.1 sulfite exporter TauE/SafE family protein [Pseudooceanicola endophyticus]MXN18273.1 TSUP family transporter [Pseudooceanicola albus]
MTDQTVLLLLAALIVGVSKGGLASAAAIAVPMLALFMNPITAAATLLPVYIVTDWIGVWLYRKDFSRRNVAILVPSILFGVFLAMLITPWSSEGLLLIFTGLIGVWYVTRSWMRRHLDEVSEARLVPGLFWGTITGIASFITHSGAPPVQAYLLPQRLPKFEFAGTIAISFAIGNLAKLPAYWAIGQLDGLNWGLIAGLVVFGVGGTFIGRWLTHILPQALYMKIIQVFLLALSVILLIKGGAELLA